MLTGFDEEYYLRLNPDVAEVVRAGKMTAEEHFLKYGDREHRNPNAVFDAAYYLASNKDLAAAKVATPYQHFVNFGRYELRDPSALFNTYYYMVKNPTAVLDGYRNGATPYDHFLNNRDDPTLTISPFFDPAKYLSANKDVAASGMSALNHFINYGIAEYRSLGNGIDLGVFRSDAKFNGYIARGDFSEAFARIAEVAPYIQSYLKPSDYTFPETLTPPSDFKPDTGVRLVVPADIKLKSPSSLPAHYDIVAKGTTGPETILGGLGNDTLFAGTGNDSMAGGAGDDVLMGGAGACTLVGGDGRDTIIAGTGANTIDLSESAPASDTVKLGGSSDITGWGASIKGFLPGHGSVQGADLLSLGGIQLQHGGTSADFSQLASAGFLTRANGAAIQATDTCVALPLTLKLKSLGAADVAAGIGAVSNVAAGDKLLLLASNGKDTGLYYYRENGIDTASVSGNELTLVAGFVGLKDPADILPGDIISSLVAPPPVPTTGVHRVGTTGPETIIGGTGNDTLEAGTGNDSISGGPGDDLLISGPGNNTLVGGEGRDTIEAGVGLNAIDLRESAPATDLVKLGGSQSIKGWGCAITGFLPGHGNVQGADVLQLGAVAVSRAGVAAPATELGSKGFTARATAAGIQATDNCVALTGTKAKSLSAADVATALNKVNSASRGDSMLLLVTDGTDTGLFYYRETLDPAKVAATELARVVTFVGISDPSALVAGDIILGGGV